MVLGSLDFYLRELATLIKFDKADSPLDGYFQWSCLRKSLIFRNLFSSLNLNLQSFFLNHFIFFLIPALNG